MMLKELKRLDEPNKIAKNPHAKIEPRRIRREKAKIVRKQALLGRNSSNSSNQLSNSIKKGKL